MKARVQRKKILNAKTQIFLYMMMHALEIPKYPSVSNVLLPFESWSDRRGLLRQIHRFEAAGMLESDGSDLKEKVMRMTSKGRVLALGGIDPTVFWKAKWDGIWRVVSFDFPEKQRGLRAGLRNVLRENHFGCLQRSLWVTPHRLGSELLGRGADVDSLNNFAVMESRFHDGAQDMDVVNEAWDFGSINESYKLHAKHLEQLPKVGTTMDSLHSWAQMEMELWHTVAETDPFLPELLLPKGYVGKKVWSQRLVTLKKLGRLIVACK